MTKQIMFLASDLQRIIQKLNFCQNGRTKGPNEAGGSAFKLGG